LRIVRVQSTCKTQCLTRFVSAVSVPPWSWSRVARHLTEEFDMQLTGRADTLRREEAKGKA